MYAVTLSDKYSVSIPKEIRKELKFSIGQQFQLVVYDSRIELIPIKNIKDMRGFLKGINTEITREDDRI